MTQSPKVSISSTIDEEITSDYSHSVQSYKLFFTFPNSSYRLGKKDIEHISVPHEIYLYAPQNIFVYAAEYSAICSGKQCYVLLYIDLFAERRDSGDGMALYGSWYGTLRVVVRHTTGRGASSQYFFRTQRHGDAEESILSVLIRESVPKRMGGNRRTQYVAFLQPCGMHSFLQVMFSASLLLYSEMRLEFIVTIFS